MALEMIRSARRGAVLVVTLARPERLNAAPSAMFDEIGEALGARGDARAVLITGEGRAFCSGADIAGGVLDGAAAGAAGGVLDGDAAGATMHAALTMHYNPVLLALADLPVPVVSAVRGAAAGIGCSLALAADFCVASDTAYFLQAFVNIGLVPDGGASWSLIRSVGRARAIEMMLLGERIAADKAFEWGLIHKVVADDALDAAALALAERLAAGPTIALGLMRRSLNRAAVADYATALAQEADDQRVALGTADAAEGVRAFLERRKPVFHSA